MLYIEFPLWHDLSAFSGPGTCMKRVTFYQSDLIVQIVPLTWPLGGKKVIRLTCGFSLYPFVTLITWSHREGSEDLKTELSAEVSIASVRFDRKAAFTWRDFKSDQSPIPLFMAHVNTATAKSHYAVYTDAPFLQFTVCKRLHVEIMFSVQAFKGDV